MKYLSPEWIAAVNEALAADEAVASATVGKQLTMQQLVDGGPDGDHASYLLVDDGSVSLVPGEADAPDFTIRTDYATSLGLQRGEVNELSAAMTGKIKPSGDLAKAATMQAPLKAIDTVMKSVDVAS